MMRARDPDYAPDGSTMVFVAGEEGRNRLMLLDLDTGRTSTLHEADDYSGFSSPRFSPSGRFVATVVRKPGGHVDIVLIDRDSGWHVPVTEDRAVDLSPSWSRTGRYLYFVSDRDGVFDDSETGELPVRDIGLMASEPCKCTRMSLRVFSSWTNRPNTSLSSGAVTRSRTV